MNHPVVMQTCFPVEHAPHQPMVANAAAGWWWRSVRKNRHPIPSSGNYSLLYFFASLGGTHPRSEWTTVRACHCFPCVVVLLLLACVVARRLLCFVQCLTIFCLVPVRSKAWKKSSLTFHKPHETTSNSNSKKRDSTFTESDGSSIRLCSLDLSTSTTPITPLPSSSYVLCLYRCLFNLYYIPLPVQTPYLFTFSDQCTTRKIL